MAKSPSIKTANLEKYQDLNLHELENVITDLEHQPPSSKIDAEIRAVHHAIRKRLRTIKARVMEFEQNNDHHLLIYDSTNNFTKIAGRSVLFYVFTIANRLHRRYSIKPDTDGYSKSNDGIISLRSLDALEVSLASINIFPDRDLSDAELHFYKLPKVYTDEQINKLRSNAREDHSRITNIIVPKSPIPILYTTLLELNQLIYHSSRRINDNLAREIIMRPIIESMQNLLVTYLEFANFSTIKSTVSNAATADIIIEIKSRNKLLFDIIVGSRNLRFSMANVENLRLLTHKDLGEILAKLVEVERIATREHQKLIRNANEQQR